MNKTSAVDVRIHAVLAPFSSASWAHAGADANGNAATTRNRNTLAHLMCGTSPSPKRSLAAMRPAFPGGEPALGRRRLAFPAGRISSPATAA
jgi:hypothetical protein